MSAVNSPTAVMQGRRAGTPRRTAGDDPHDRRRGDTRTAGSTADAPGRSREGYFARCKVEYLRFLIPEQESVLLFGCEDGALLDALRPSRGVGVDRSAAMIAQARRVHPDHEYHAAADDCVALDGTFEYIILDDVAGDIADLYPFLQGIRGLCSPTSRLVIVQHNYLWQPLFWLASALRLKRPKTRQSWLSPGDIRVFLDAVGFETTDIRSKLYCPGRWLGIGPIVNWLAGLVPFIDRLGSTQILVARPASSQVIDADKSASIVLTTRDERDNIEPMVRATPQVGSQCEILFVEGHSTDGTRQEIERMILAYPEKNIRLLVQDGTGQGEAIRKGFSEARGDVVILLEADQTSPPEDVRKAFEVIASGRAEFVNGSRFIYPRDPGAMPLLNMIGNWLFAFWFTWFLGQRTSDVLCGLKAIDRRQFRRLLANWGFLGLRDPFGDFELAFGAARLGLKISEVPTRYACRRHGAPKTKFFRHGFMLLRMAARATVVFKCR